MDRYGWNILGLCEVRWNNFCKTRTEEELKDFFSGKEAKHEHGIWFLVHKNTMNSVMGCCPVSSRLITIRLRAVPFNITVVLAYASTSDSNDNELEEFYDQLQNVIDQTPKKDMYSSCTRRLECKSEQGCLWKLARHLWTLLQQRHKWKLKPDSLKCPSYVPFFPLQIYTAIKGNICSSYIQPVIGNKSRHCCLLKESLSFFSKLIAAWSAANRS